jgi:hypothetical protein
LLLIGLLHLASRLLSGLLHPLLIVTLIVIVLTLLLLRLLLLGVANTSNSLLDGPLLIILIREVWHHYLLLNLLLSVAHFVEDSALLSAVVIQLLGGLLALGHGQSLLNWRIVVLLLVVSAHYSV